MADCGHTPSLEAAHPGRACSALPPASLSWVLRLPGRFERDQVFTEAAATRLETMDVIDGSW